MTDATDRPEERVGFVGLGRMGMPMAVRLAAAGYVVVGYDVLPEIRHRIAGSGVRPAINLAEVAQCGTVVLMLPGSDAVDEVLISSGLLASLAPGSVIVDMSSSVPQRTRELALAARERGIEFVDAPVSGGVTGAEQGTLTTMVGGQRAAIERVQPVLKRLASRVVPTGDSGSGHAVKALNNLMSATHLLVTSEAVLAAEAFGLDPELVLAAVNGSSGRSGSTENKWPSFVLPGTYDSGFPLALMLKDMRIALDLEDAAGVFAPLSETSVGLWAEAARELRPSADHTEIVRWLRARADRDTRRRMR